MTNRIALIETRVGELERSVEPSKASVSTNLANVSA